MYDCCLSLSTLKLWCIRLFTVINHNAILYAVGGNRLDFVKKNDDDDCVFLGQNK